MDYTGSPSRQVPARGCGGCVKLSAQQSSVHRGRREGADWLNMPGRFGFRVGPGQ